MDKALSYLSLARKAGKAELGEEPAGAAARMLHAHLIVVAADASDHTWRRAKSYVAGTDQACIRLPYTKDEIGMAIGRTSLAIAAITDPALALALVQALPQPEKHAAILDVLTEKAQRLRKRQSEAKAHLRNRRSGKKKN
ncbi:MAG: 50S ribosomal protein L7 [Oscillospiraceae bacterium]|nr:50S ribosomal protein L7 [Oscillospiraceae bacterium]